MGRLGFCLSVGTLLMLLGGFPLLLFCGFASMGAHGLDGWDYWARVLPRMFNFSNSDGWASSSMSAIFLFGAGLFCYGIFAAIADGVRSVWRTK